jgi:hypothetical protein
MAKIVRLTESDLTRLVRRVVNEQAKAGLATELVNSPRLNKMVDNVLGNLNPRELNNIKSSLRSVGIGPNTDVLDSVSMDSDGEMMEDDERADTKESVKDKVLAGLAAIGIVNTATFAIPLTYLIDQVFPQMTSGTMDGKISFILGLILTLIGGSRIFPKKN